MFTAIVLVSISIGWYSSEHAAYFRINKSLQIFGELFRQLSNDYVDEIDPQEFVQAGIDGMLKHLDPYTVYIDDEDHDEVDIITTGVYGGLGFTTGLLDSNVTIVGIAEGSPAERAGLRVGDKIYKIDSTIVLKTIGNELRRYTRGKVGAQIVMQILREGRKDTLRFDLVRQEVTLKNVTYSGVVGENLGNVKRQDIGYIRLERFTYGAGAEVQEAISSLRRQQPDLKGIVLDLRDNPGGLLDAANAVSEMFVPSSSLIVSTRGRSADSEHRYFSRRSPVEPDVPLAVLINEHSASASEIVAGAVQDLDRGVLVGERSFGKGLVQTITTLPFNASLKMTTAKYYTPSGRCIQKIDYTQRRQGIIKSAPDTSKIYRTFNGRIVRESNGITPDSAVSVKTISPLLTELLSRNLVFSFANEYAGKRSTLPEDFTVTKQVFDEFSSYVRRKTVSAGVSLNPAARKIEELEAALKTQNASQTALKQLASVKTQLAAEYFREIDQQRSTMNGVLFEEILERFHPRSKVIAASLGSDIQVQAAVALLHNPTRYATILAKKR